MKKFQTQLNQKICSKMSPKLIEIHKFFAKHKPRKYQKIQSESNAFVISLSKGSLILNLYYPRSIYRNKTCLEILQIKTTKSHSKSHSNIKTPLFTSIKQSKKTFNAISC